MANGENIVYTPWFWRWIMGIIRAVPESIFRRPVSESEPDLPGHCLASYFRVRTDPRSSGSRSEMETWSGRARQTAGMTHHVISTMAIPYVTKLIPDLPDAHRAKLDAIRNIGVVCVVLKLRKSVTPHFWVNINDACRGAGHCRVLEPQADA